MNPSEEGKEKALRYYRILAVVLGLLGATLLILGIVSVVKDNKYETDDFGPPYFVGGFVVGIMGLLGCAVCTCVLVKAPDADTDVKKRELACAMQGHYILSMFTIMGCFAGTVLAGIGGFGFSSFNDDEDAGYKQIKKTLAGVILALCIVMLLVTIVSLCVVCTYGSYFGVVIQNRRGANVVVWTNNGSVPNQGVNMNTTQYGMGGMNNTLFGTVSGNNDQIRQLEEQNRLLRQQLELQRQLNEQQQQQQQNSGGFYPPAPANYGFTDPSAPPPSYDSVKYT